MVRPKKHLGQHFLTDLKIAQRIVDSLEAKDVSEVLEIGAGMGVLTEFLLKKEFNTYVIELDNESVDYLERHFLQLQDRIIKDDFLKFN
jgi:16S rRNA (adenine1518-N6/adenine1519-N6)-dimethyltransferase